MSTSGIDSAAVTTQLESLQQNPSTKNSENLVQTLLGGASESSSGNDVVDVSLKDIYKSLTVLAQQVLDKLQEILGDELPDGIASLKPEDHTPEKTAQNIVDGATALFGVFAKQNSNLQGEDLLDAFMKTIRGGIDTGYGQADKILGDIGAYDIDGVKSGIDETKKLVEEKLKAFEDNYRKQNGLVTDSGTDKPKTATTASTPTTVSQVA